MAVGGTLVNYRFAAGEIVLTSSNAEPRGGPSKILIVDDHPPVREALSLWISRRPDMEVCGEADDVAEALRLVDATHPDVIVIDIQLKTGNGLDLIKRIKARYRAARMLVWSTYHHSSYAKRAIKAGALGYINKEHATTQVVEAIQRVREGRLYLPDDLAEQILTGAIRGDDAMTTSPEESLSDRELEVFTLIGEGVSTSEIARRLHVTVHTIDTHRQRIKQKLNLQTAGELTRTAAQWAAQDNLADHS
jgi:DNA-binding NarL/FixJ family response regulator